MTTHPHLPGSSGGAANHAAGFRLREADTNADVWLELEEQMMYNVVIDEHGQPTGEPIIWSKGGAMKTETFLSISLYLVTSYLRMTVRLTFIINSPNGSPVSVLAFAGRLWTVVLLSGQAGCEDRRLHFR